MGRPSIADWVWDDPEVQDLVQPALRSDEVTEREDLIRGLNRIRSMGRELGGDAAPGPRPGNRQIPVFVPTLSRIEQARTMVLSAYAAQVATRLPQVCSFRERDLAGPLLSEREVRPFLESQTNAESEAAWEETEKTRRQVVDDAEGFLRRLLSGAPAEKPRTLEVARQSERELPHRVRVTTPSLVRLHEAAYAVVAAVHWKESEATWFVLTGEYPMMYPVVGHAAELELSTTTPGYAQEIVLTVQPWVSVETVQRTYAQMQHSLRFGRGRVLALKGMTVFAFVEGHRDIEGKLPTWQMLCNKWNDQHSKPEERFEHYRRLHEAYSKVHAALFRLKSQPNKVTHEDDGHALITD